MFETPQAMSSNFNDIFVFEMSKHIFFATVNIPLWPLCAYNVTVFYFPCTTTFIYPTNNCTMGSKSFQYRFCVFLFNNLKYLTKLWVQKLMKISTSERLLPHCEPRQQSWRFIIYCTITWNTSKNTCSLLLIYII